MFPQLCARAETKFNRLGLVTSSSSPHTEPTTNTNTNTHHSSTCLAQLVAVVNTAHHPTLHSKDLFSTVDMVTTRAGTEATPPAESAPSTPIKQQRAGNVAVSTSSTSNKMDQQQVLTKSRNRSSSKTREDVDAK